LNSNNIAMPYVETFNSCRLVLKLAFTSAVP
jgi:hypothetical protein